MAHRGEVSKEKKKIKIRTMRIVTLFVPLAVLTTTAGSCNQAVGICQHRVTWDKNAMQRDLW